MRESSISGDRLDQLAKDIARTTAPIFKEQGWEWRDEGVPGEARIEATVRRLIDHAGKSEDISSGTGRFYVSHYFEDGEEHYAIALDLADLSAPIKGEGGDG